VETTEHIDVSDNVSEQARKVTDGHKSVRALSCRCRYKIKHQLFVDLMLYSFYFSRWVVADVRREGEV